VGMLMQAHQEGGKGGDGEEGEGDWRPWRVARERLRAEVHKCVGGCIGGDDE
jgi:hypothetical protein